MHHEYRRRVQFLLEEKREAEDQLKWWKDHKKEMRWYLRLLTANSRMVNEMALERVIHAIDIALLKIRHHYWWHYSVSGRNPFKFPVEIEAKIVSHGLIFERTRTVTWNYTKFMK